MTIVFKNKKGKEELHRNTTLSKCGKFYVASNKFTKFNINKCTIYEG